MTMKWLLKTVPYTLDVTRHLLFSSNAMSLNMKIIVDSSHPEGARRIILALQDAAIDVDIIHEPSDCRAAPACRWIDASCVNPDGRLAGALLDAIQTIEDTRHSFKSKQLGALRKRLQQTLDACQTDRASLTCNS